MKNFLLSVLFFTASLTAFSQGSLETDRQALVAFYIATNGDEWFNNTGWNVPGSPGDNPCGWFGITCEGGRVTRFIMEQNDVYTIPPAIGNLSALTHLDLSGAGVELPQITGDIPVELGNLTNLQYLDLSENPIGGANISVIGNLVNLKHLSISPFRWSVPASFANLVNLEYLRIAVEEYPMNDVGIAGPIPDFFGNFLSLKTLIMTRAGVTGTLPSNLGNLTNLEVLDLSFNHIEGTIPSTFNNLQNLVAMNVSTNWLSGTIPDLSDIPNAASISISNNRFTFAGLEENISKIDVYKPQARFNFSSHDGFPALSVIDAAPAGGTVANNTYRFFKNNVLVRTQVGNGQYIVSYTERGTYRVEVTNSLVPDLTLLSNEVFIEPPMPVTLVSFAGEESGTHNFLTWQTSSETNNAGFEIERSIDARTFDKIGFVDGNGDSKETNNYHFKDHNPFATTYYRLKQLDYDGKFEYSSIISVKNAGKEVSVYPSPAMDQILVKGIDKKEEVTLIDVRGSVVWKANIEPSKPLSMKNVRNGVYVLKIGEEVRKILIQK